MRLFIALKTDLDKNKVFSVEKALMRRYHNVKWVDKDNLHLTLKFLGEVDDLQSGSIKSKLEDIARNFTGFSYAYYGISAFPNKKRARVIFVAVKSGERIVELMKVIDSNLSTLGFGREKSYVPHLTLGRAREPLNITHSDVDFPPLNVNASGLHLIKSTLTKYGPIYEVIAQFDFA